MNDVTGSLLVVDDNEMNRDMLARRLQRRGHRVQVAESGERAIEILENEEFDLALLDIMMPGIDGMELLRRIRERHTAAELPVIMVTSKDQSEDVVAALETGANDYLTKPLDFPVVIARVQTQLRLKNLSDLKDQFLQIASHDLKNPLSAVLGAANVLPKLTPPGQPLSDEARHLLARIEIRALEMKAIIEDFLDFQALDDGSLAVHPQAADLNGIVDSIVSSNAEYAAEKKVTIGFEPGPGLGAVPLDRARIAQVAQNLVGNSIKFSPPETRVQVRTRNDSGQAIFEVIDQGPGLRPEDMPKLFVKYARLANKPTGREKSSGLGLYIAKQLIDLHKGTIGATNNPDKGATFWFKLPLS